MDSGSWWWTGRPGVLWFMGSQRVRHDWVTELNSLMMETISCSLFCDYLSASIKLSSTVLNTWQVFGSLKDIMLPSFSGYCFCCCTIVKSCPTLWDHIDCRKPGFPVSHHLPEFAQVHVHWISDAIQPSYPLLPTSPSAFNLSQHQGRFQWVSSSIQVVKVLELKLQYQ